MLFFCAQGGAHPSASLPSINLTEPHMSQIKIKAIRKSNSFYFCAHTKDANRKPSAQNYPFDGKFIYTSDNTSPIIHKPLNKKQLIILQKELNEVLKEQECNKSNA